MALMQRLYPALWSYFTLLDHLHLVTYRPHVVVNRAKPKVTTCQRLSVWFLISAAVLIIILICLTPLANVLESYVASTVPETLQNTLNLVEEDSKNNATYFDFSVCTVDYINKNKLQQNHPCVIRILRNYYINRDIKNNYTDLLNELGVDNFHNSAVFCLLRNREFSMECGAVQEKSTFDDLFVRKFLKWKETHHDSKKMASITPSKYWTLPACLSLNSYPTEVLVHSKHNSQQHSPLSELSSGNTSNDHLKTQCFPLYSILLAVGRTEMNYFSIDAGGHELDILKTIPWEKVDIKMLAVPKNRNKSTQKSVLDHMTANGYCDFGEVIVQTGTHFQVFIQDFLRNWRLVKN